MQGDMITTVQFVKMKMEITEKSTSNRKLENEWFNPQTQFSSVPQYLSFIVIDIITLREKNPHSQSQNYITSRKP